MKIQQEITWGNLSTCFYMKYINVANFESFTEPSGVFAHLRVQWLMSQLANILLN